MRAALAFVAFAAALAARAEAPAAGPGEPSPDYLPDAGGMKIATISESGTALASIVVMTEGVAIKETGPKETVKTFGETYQFAPSFLAVRRDEATRIEFWNLQPDDEHDVMLFDPDWNTLLKQTLPP